MSSCLFEVLAFPVPEILYQMDIPVAKEKYNIPSSGSVDLGSRAPLRMDMRGRRGRGPNMVINLPSSEQLGEEKLEP